MLFVTDITDDKARKAAGDFLCASEMRAREVAPNFDVASKITFLPVKQRGRGAAFNLVGHVNGGVAEMTVAIPHDMPEADAWFIWAWVFAEAGLDVDLDGPYRDFAYELMDEEAARREAEYEADPEAFIATVEARVCTGRAALAY